MCFVRQLIFVTENMILTLMIFTNPIFLGRQLEEVLICYYCDQITGKHWVLYSNQIPEQDQITWFAIP